MAKKMPAKSPAAKATRKRTLTKAQAALLYERLAALKPEPKTELDYSDPFTLLVAVVLSAQATDKGVNKATPALFAAADTPAKMAALGEDGIAARIKTIGLWRAKAKNVFALSKILVERFGAVVPRRREDLEALPGVGRKTANVVMAEAFGEPTIAVDTHVFRVATRTGLSHGKTPNAVEADLMRITPPQFLHGAHHWLILHGRYVCVARTPKCGACAIADLCAFPQKTGHAKAAKSASTKRGAPSGA